MKRSSLNTPVKPPIFFILPHTSTISLLSADSVLTMNVEREKELVQLTFESHFDHELLKAVQDLRQFLNELKLNFEAEGQLNTPESFNNIELFLFLKNKFEVTNDPVLRLEIASFLASFAPGLSSTPLDIYPILVTALSSASDYSILEDIFDVLLKATANPTMKVNHRLIDAGGVSAILRHTRNLDDNLRVKACRLIAKLFAWHKLDAVQPPSISGVLPFVLECFHSNNYALVASGAEALISFTGYYEGNIDEILARDINLPIRLSELLLSHVETVVFPVVRTISNIISESPRRLPSLIDAGVVLNLLWLLDHPNKSIVLEVCRAIAQITERSQEHFQTVVEAALLPKLLLLFQSEEADIGVKYSISSVLNCILTEGTDDQKDYLINEGSIVAICKVWKSIDFGIKNHRVAGVLRTLYSALTGLSKEFEKADETRRERIRVQFKASQNDLIKKLQAIKELNVFVRDDVVINFLQSLD